MAPRAGTAGSVSSTLGRSILPRARMRSWLLLSLLPPLLAGCGPRQIQFQHLTCGPRPSGDVRITRALAPVRDSAGLIIIARARSGVRTMPRADLEIGSRASQAAVARLSDTSWHVPSDGTTLRLRVRAIGFDPTSGEVAARSGYLDTLRVSLREQVVCLVDGAHHRAASARGSETDTDLR